MYIHVEPVNDKNREAVLALKIDETQKGFVESPEQCLKEAAEEKCWRPVGIYDGEQLVGFSMYGYFWQYLPFGRVWLDRLLIDRDYQGHGYGHIVLPMMIGKLRSEYHRKKIYLSVVEENQGAIHLYEKFGFQFNGETDVHGEKVMVLKETLNRSAERSAERNLN